MPMPQVAQMTAPSDWPKWMRGLQASVQPAMAAAAAASRNPHEFSELLSDAFQKTAQMPHVQAQTGEKAKLAAAYAAQAFLALLLAGLIGTKQPVIYLLSPDMLAAFQHYTGMLQVDSQELCWLNQQLTQATIYHSYKHLQLPSVEVTDLFAGVVRLPPLILLPSGALQPHSTATKASRTSRCILYRHPADGPDTWRALLMADPLRFYQHVIFMPQPTAASSNTTAAGQHSAALPESLQEILSSATPTQQSAVKDLLRFTGGSSAGVRAITPPMQKAAEYHAHRMYQDRLDVLLTVSVSLPGAPGVPANPPNTRKLSDLMRAEVEAQPSHCIPEPDEVPCQM